MEKNNQKMRKTNSRLYPTYKKLAWDYLFFYTIDFLFLTQVKGISAADVVLKSTFYAFFTIFMQIPANIIVEFLGRKNSIILGNVLNCFYMVIIMLSRNLADLAFAEFISATAFGIKNMAEPSLLNESIIPSKNKGKTYAKIDAKGASGYYVLDAISKIISGYLFTVNPYLPIICSLVVLIVVVILSMAFIEPIQKNKSNKKILNVNQLKDIQEGFKYVLKSDRLKALILCSAFIAAIISILSILYVSLLEDLNISATIIGIIAAIGSLLSAYASKKQNIIHNKLRNKTLLTMALTFSITTIISGICGIKANQYLILLVIIIVMNILGNMAKGIYYTVIMKYLRNFTNRKIDTKIFATEHMVSGIIRVVFGLLASFILDRTTTANAMIIIGIIFTIIYILTGKYMKTRVGLKPEEYSKEETKFAE